MVVGAGLVRGVPWTFHLTVWTNNSACQLFFFSGGLTARKGNKQGNETRNLAARKGNKKGNETMNLAARKGNEEGNETRNLTARNGSKEGNGTR